MIAERPTILVVDDERLNRTAMAELLSPHYRVLLARDGVDGLERARQEADQIALILLDVTMPGMNGYEVLSTLRSNEATAEIAVIFITGQNDETDEERGLSLGAADYIHKPIRPAIVKARVRNLVNLALQSRALRQLVRSDGLTGISNRRHFDEALVRACLRARRTGEPVGVALIDIDHFKLFNDHYGHVAGDEALRTVAQLLAQHARRPYDVAARFGGEEFALLVPQGASIRELTERFRQNVLTLNISHDRSPTTSILSVSCGALLASSAQLLSDQGALLRKADELLYDAKFHGRNRVVYLRE